MLDQKECQIVVDLIGFTWQNGGVRSEQAAMDLHQLKAKVTHMAQNLTPPAAPPPAVGVPVPARRDGDVKPEALKTPTGPPKAEGQNDDD